MLLTLLLRLHPRFYQAFSLMHQLNHLYDLAIQQYTKVHNLEPSNKRIYYPLSHCYRMQKDYKVAEELLLEILNLHPYWPEELFELGLVYADWGKTEEALEYLKKANSIWEEADPEYEPAIKCRDKLTEIQNSGI